MIVGGFPKLSETFILDQITGLIDLGHEVDVYARRSVSESAVHDEVKEYDLLARTHAFDLPGTRWSRVERALRILLREMPRHTSVMARCMNLGRYKSVYAVLNNVMHVEPFLKRKYDVIFCHFGGNGVEFAFLKDVFREARFVAMFHGDDLSLGDEQGPEVFKSLRRVGDMFLVNTDCYGGAKLREAGFESEKIATFHYGLAVEKVAFRERAPRGGRVRILSVARLVPKKGLEFGIRGVAELQNANPQLGIEYRIIGDGELKGRLGRTIGELGGSRSIELLGALSRSEVMQWMHESDIFLLPSLLEQAGMVLVEAQASGMPIVASRVGGVPEMVREGRSALLVPPGDSRAITLALQRLVDDPERWAAMGHEGRRFVEEHHDLEVQKVRLAELLAV